MFPNSNTQETTSNYFLNTKAIAPTVSEPLSQSKQTTDQAEVTADEPVKNLPPDLRFS